jgi:hypothetical protein
MDYTPADFVSRAIVHIATHSTAPGATYHLRHPTGIPVREILRVFRSAGFALEEVPYATFWRRLEEAGQAAGADGELTLLRSLITGAAGVAGKRGPTSDILREVFDMDVRRVLNGKAVSALEGSGTALPDDPDRLIRSYADHCKRHGEGTRAEMGG